MGTLYLRHESGATHAFSGRREAKLRKAILAGQGGPEIVALIEAGYTGFMAIGMPGVDGDMCLDSEALEQFYKFQAG